jgi:uncharacterized MAPEG superfamily protein
MLSLLSAGVIQMSMNSSMLALLGLALWTLLLLIGIAVLRVAITIVGKQPANGFSVWGDEVSPFSARLCRAHANCYENLPHLIAILVAAQITGNAHITDPLALLVLAARIAQSMMHLISVSNRAVLWRFVFMLVQIAIATLWSVRLLYALVAQTPTST